MRPASLSRPLALALLAVVVAGLAGCSWFKKGAKGDYALAPEMRPLEVPPDLTLPNNSGATQIPNTASQVRPQAPQPGGTGNGFYVSSTKDDAFKQAGELLGGIEGATINSRAQLLGSYDVTYMGSTFLVRISESGAGTNVSAIDSRGLPATNEAAVKLMAELKAGFGN